MSESKIKAEEEAARLLAYQQHAMQTDDVVTKCLAVCDQAAPELAEALVAGAMTALVRFYATKTRFEGQQIITRDLVVGLNPGLHRSAEEVAKQLNLLDKVPLANPQ